MIGHMSDALPAGESMISETDMAAWFFDGPDETGDAEHAAWLRGLPDDVRADYLSRPSAGPLESEPAGFGHHDDASASGGGSVSAQAAHMTACRRARIWPGSQLRPTQIARTLASPRSSACCAPGSGSPPGLRPARRRR